MPYVRSACQNFESLVSEVECQ